MREQEGGLAAIAEVPAALKPGDSDLAFLGPHLPDHIACAIAAGGPSTGLTSFRSGLVCVGRCASRAAGAGPPAVRRMAGPCLSEGKLHTSAHIRSCGCMLQWLSTLLHASLTSSETRLLATGLSQLPRPPATSCDRCHRLRAGDIDPMTWEPFPDTTAAPAAALAPFGQQGRQRDHQPRRQQQPLTQHNRQSEGALLVLSRQLRSQISCPYDEHTLALASNSMKQI